MKQIAFILLCVFGVLIVPAQNTATDSMSIDAAINACIAMRDAIAANDSAAILQSAKDLKAVGVTNFNSLRCKDDTLTVLAEDHVIFNEEYAEAKAEGREPFPNVGASPIHRGQTADGSILTKTCFVKAGKSTKYSFASKGHQELAVVAESGGLVTMKVHVTNSAGLDKRFDDTKNVKKGMPQRKTSFELPTDRRNTVELEVINCGTKDCSFVVISN